MNIDNFLNKLQEFWRDFSCNNCCAFNEGCTADHSCVTQCFKEFIQANNLTIMRKDDIFANELIERITIKYVKEILLNIDWDDYGKYQEDKCGALDCKNCEYAGKQYCQEKIFLKYLKEKPL